MGWGLRIQHRSLLILAAAPAACLHGELFVPDAQPSLGARVASCSSNKRRWSGQSNQPQNFNLLRHQPPASVRRCKGLALPVSRSLSYLTLVCWQWRGYHLGRGCECAAVNTYTRWGRKKNRPVSRFRWRRDRVHRGKEGKMAKTLDWIYSLSRKQDRLHQWKLGKKEPWGEY